jgi:hypothetical protein
MISDRLMFFRRRYCTARPHARNTTSAINCHTWVAGMNSRHGQWGGEPAQELHIILRRIGFFSPPPTPGAAAGRRKNISPTKGQERVRES